MSIYSASTTKPDLDSYKGRVGRFEIDGLSFAVEIIDARLRFGHLDLLIVPKTGAGERWVEQHRVLLPDVVPAPEVVIESKGDESAVAPISAINYL